MKVATFLFALFSRLVLGAVWSELILSKGSNLESRQRRERKKKPNILLGATILVPVLPVVSRAYYSLAVANDGLVHGVMLYKGEKGE